MVNQLASKNCENISHIEVPTKLLQQRRKRQKSPVNEGGNQMPQSKKERNTKAENEEGM